MVKIIENQSKIGSIVIIRTLVIIVSVIIAFFETKEGEDVQITTKHR